MERDWKTLMGEFDPAGMFDRIFKLPEQLLEAEGLFERNNLLLDSREFRQVLMLGMGGSAIGGNIVAEAIRKDAEIPVFVSRGYDVPEWCGPGTLVIATSYSGGTEETLSSVSEAIDRGAVLVAITTGGRLGELAAAQGCTLLDVPSGYPPRSALAFLTLPALLILEQYQICPPWRNTLPELRTRLSSMREEWNLEEDPAGAGPVRLAESLHGTLPVIYHGGGEMEPVAIRWCGQFAENGKTLSHRHSFPELNHNEIVGWENPQKLLRETSLIILRNESDHARVKEGMEITEKLLAPCTSKVVRVAVTGDNPLERIFSAVYLGDMISYHMALGNGVDPTPVHRIDTLKSELHS